ncbi:hypothetical protein SCHPADRAFT_892081, partial [Schizopora paradoxa]
MAGPPKSGVQFILAPSALDALLSCTRRRVLERGLWVVVCIRQVGLWMPLSSYREMNVLLAHDLRLYGVSKSYLEGTAYCLGGIIGAILVRTQNKGPSAFLVTPGVGWTAGDSDSDSKGRILSAIDSLLSPPPPLIHSSRGFTFQSLNVAGSSSPQASFEEIPTGSGSDSSKRRARDDQLDGTKRMVGDGSKFNVVRKYQSKGNAKSVTGFKRVGKSKTRGHSSDRRVKPHFHWLAHPGQTTSKRRRIPSLYWGKLFILRLRDLGPGQGAA